ncbi:heterokaryon incompatibility protein-domain-containing protein [Xylaria acuta]|nr:heterokaryon incompatibility protein-domain-containing protein [Xylaria acuta]
MRLLNSKTRQLKEFFGDIIPPYAILSTTSDSCTKARILQIDQTCLLAVKDQLEWVWIDTCCINKSSSAELSEAINSMFDWYAAARVCYVYLEDLPSSNSREDATEAFRKTRWLTRGWTLQEFIAPSHITMFNSSWEEIKRSDFQLFDASYTPDKPRPLAPMLVYYFTGIQKADWKFADVPTIFLLGVKMSLIYGEGSEAFPRLLEEVIKKSDSHGVLAAWYGSPYSTTPSDYLHILPQSPLTYRSCITGFRDVPVSGKSTSTHFSLTNAGLSIELPFMMIDNRSQVVLGLLNCQDKSNGPNSLVAIRCQFQ